LEAIHAGISVPISAMMIVETRTYIAVDRVSEPFTYPWSISICGSAAKILRLNTRAKR